MNNFGLIISGNLTGFTTFYETPNVNGILNGVKFNFDFRDLTTILGNEDKAYAISFAPSIIAVSLVSCLLDSFRRPGVLVVSVILPRSKKIESAMNMQNEKALYQLLNALHDTFREKNFVNGMLNQNKAVLMQDYYSDILSNYVLVPDTLQRPINSRIDFSSANKRLGYVKSTEDNVPLYLSSLCRKSYEGYHHIFIAANAPQNIDEEPVEVVLYNVTITNDNHRIPSVKLTDKIPNVLPGEGEIDIETKNYTYQQVLNGEAGRNIVASIIGETIEISYRFGKETKEIHFKFTDGNNVIPFASICPRIVYADRTENISNEVWLFEGKEIYERKTIECGNNNYIIKKESANLDIKKQKDGSICLIQVERCSPIQMSFLPPYNKPKTITFRRSNNTPISFEVTDSLHEMLPGKLEEYTYTVDSNYYEGATGMLQPLGVPFMINLRIKEALQTSRTSTKRGGGYADVTPRRVGTSAKGVNNGGTLTLEGDTPNLTTHIKTKKDAKRNFTIIGAASTAIIAIILCLVFFGGDLVKTITEKGDSPDVIAEKDSVNRDLVITFLDKDNDSIGSKYIDFSTFSELVKLEITPDNFIQPVDKKTDGVFELKYNINGQASEIGIIEFTILLGKVEISDGLEKDSIEASELLSESGKALKKEIKLSLRTSEILLYRELLEKVGQKITTEQKEKYLKKIAEIDCVNNHNSKIVTEMLRTLEGLKISETKLAPKDKVPDQGTSKSPKTDSGLDAQLPPDIKGTISSGSQIGSKRVEKYKGEQQQALLDYRWLYSNKYNKKIPKAVKDKLAKCKTFRNLQTVAREN